MIQLMKRRDRQEDHIATLEEQQKINLESQIRMNYGIEEAKKNYETWKKENDIKGLRY
jgi:hypothetical protein